MESLERENARMRAEIERLTALIEELRRKQHRPHAPFSNNSPKDNPKQPGRKGGENYGKTAHREIPPKIDEVYDVPLPAACPTCDGDIRERSVAAQYQTEIPRKPIVRRFDVHLGVCACCGKRVQGRHPLQTSDALGAAASQLGPDAQALATTLNKEAGLSHGKIQRVFQTAFGITFSRGASAQIMLRAARRCKNAYKEIQIAVKNSDWCVPDETGWRVGARLHWLHAFVTKSATLYLIRDSRGFDVAEEALGPGYAGRLTRDGWKPYDRFLQADHQQCNSHLLRRCDNLLKVAAGGAVWFPRKVKALLKEGLAVRDERDERKISLSQATAESERLELALNGLCRPKKHAGNQRLAAFLEERCGEIFYYLTCPGADATNWRAEQAIRPAVVNRKVWGGSRTPDGAEAQGILTSVLRTACQIGTQTIDFLSKTLRAPTGQAPCLINTAT